MKRGRKPLEIAEIARRCAEEWSAMGSYARVRYKRILANLCVECGASAAPDARRCEVCALNNLRRVQKSNWRAAL